MTLLINGITFLSSKALVKPYGPSARIFTILILISNNIMGEESMKWRQDHPRLDTLSPGLIPLCGARIAINKSFIGKSLQRIMKLMPLPNHD